MDAPIGIIKTSSIDDAVANIAAIAERMDADPAAKHEFMTKPQGNPITPGEAVISAAKWAEKQIRNATNAGQDWLDGVLHPSRDPVAAAIKAAPKYKARMAESLAQDKWVKSMAKVDSSSIAGVAQRVGAAGYAAGIAARVEKITRVVAELQPKVSALRAQILNMPDGTDQERENRMLAAKRGMQAIGKQRRGI
jgi:hypothetical protein